MNRIERSLNTKFHTFAPALGGENIIIGQTDGKETIAQASGVFTGGIDLDFNWRTEGSDKPTKETHVQVFEMIMYGTFVKMFSGFMKSPAKRLCLQESQIVSFVKNHWKWLGGYGDTCPCTAFLLTLDKKFFAACVDLDGNGMPKVRVHRLRSHAPVWSIGGPDKIVVPKP
jgi:hypothetical protein